MTKSSISVKWAVNFVLIKKNVVWLIVTNKSFNGWLGGQLEINT